MSSPLPRPGLRRYFGLVPFALSLALLPADAHRASHPARASRPAPPARACLEAVPLDFGAVAVGERAESVLTVTNRCPRSLTVSKITGGTPSIVVSLPRPVAVPAHGSAEIPVAFSPQDTGAAQASLVLHAQHPRQTAQARVSGRGIAPEPEPGLSVSPLSVNLALDPAEADTFRLSVTNHGTFPRAEILVDGIGDPIPRPERGWRVLYLNTSRMNGWKDDILGILDTLANVDTAETWDGTESLPSVSRLLEYDAVVVSVSHPWKDSVGAGNLLADYLEAGGKVLLTAGTLMYGTHRLYGRIADYTPIGPAQGTSGGPSGTLADHPITAGVGAFTANSSVLQETATHGQGSGSSLGTYQNGILIGAYHRDKPLVVLNLTHYGLSGDVPRLFANTLDYLGSMVAWLTPRPPFDPVIFVVPEGETRELTVTVHSHRLAAGTHRGAVELWNVSDTDAVPMQIPVTLEVAARAKLSVEPAAIDFGDAWQGGRSARPVRLVNIGTLPARVSGFASDRAPFSIAAALPLDIPAFDYALAEATFAPTALGPDSGVVTVQSDAAGSPVSVSMKGIGIVPPILSVSPEGFEATVAPGDSVVQTLHIRNPGGDSLKVALRPVADSGAGTPGTGPEKVTVLYIHTTYHSFEHPSDFFLWNLLMDPRIDSVVVFPARDSLPSLEYMKQFGFVLVVGGVPWPDPVAMGDRLADYVDAGGRVCVMHAALVAGSGLGGRFIGPEYSPVAPGREIGGLSMERAEPHPIMEGITQSLRSDNALEAQATQGDGRPLGWSWNGNLMGAYNARKPVVYLNILPIDGFYDPILTVRLLGNTFAWLSDFHTWLQPATRILALGPGEEADVDIVFGRPGGPGPGSYTGRLEVHHNALNTTSPMILPASLTVTGSSTASGN